MEKKKKKLCFVVGPIGKSDSAERRHADLLLNAIIKNVLEHDAFGYRVKRADHDADPGMISDRIIHDIINAELVVADLTDLNPNVFYELGIRHSREKPTIHIARAGTALPFDNFNHRTIFVDLGDWDSQEAARSSLKASASAIDVDGYKVSNPITSANASFQMRESADPQERVISDLKDRIAALENQRPVVGDKIFDLTNRRFSKRKVGNLAHAIMLSPPSAAAQQYMDSFPAANRPDAMEFVSLMKAHEYGGAAEIHRRTESAEPDATDFVRVLAQHIVDNF